MPNIKLEIPGVPVQCLNFVKHYCQLVCDNEEQFWRRTVAGEVVNLVNIIDLEGNTDKNKILKMWGLDEAIKYLYAPRGEDSRKLDREDQKNWGQRDRKKKQG